MRAIFVRLKPMNRRRRLWLPPISIPARAGLTFDLLHRGHHTISLESRRAATLDLLHRGHHTIALTIVEQ